MTPCPESDPFRIGASIARQLAAQGAKIIIHYLENTSFPSEESSFEHAVEGKKSAQKVVKSIEDLPGEAEIFNGDLSIAKSWKT